MDKYHSGRLGVKVAMTVNLLIMVVITLGTTILITQQTRRLEKELLLRGKQHAILGAKMMTTILEEAVENRVFTIKEIFDTNYQPIKNFTPPKYHTKYDQYFDRTILGLIDQFLEDESIQYAIASDRNGYVPTHNSRYQQPFANNIEVDRTGNRTKRIFDDEIGIKAAQNTQPGFLQVYRRDTGDILWDISSPIVLRGRHWGGFRVGLSLSAIAQAKKELSITLFTIMTAILIISAFLTFIIVNRYLIPIRRLSGTINKLAQGRTLDDEIRITEGDEIGEMQNALERLRISMLIALKRINQNSRMEAN